MSNFIVGKGAINTTDEAGQGRTTDGTPTGEILPALGVLSISGGSIVADSGFMVAQNDDSIGTLFMTGGKVQAAGDFRLGVDAVFTDGDGIASFNGDNPARGFAMITGGTIMASDFESAVSGVGEAHVGGNAVLQLADSLHAASAGGIGMLSLAGNADVSVGSFVAVAPGTNGRGILNVGGNAKVRVMSGFNISTGTNTQATVNLTGGEVEVAEGLVIRGVGASAGTLNQTAGLLSVDGTIDATNGGVHLFSGGTLTRSDAGDIDYSGDLTMSSTATVKFDADKTLSVSGSFDVSGGGVFALDGVTLDAGMDSYFFITVGNGNDFTDDTSLENALLSGLINPFGAIRITELDFEAGNFNALVDNVFSLVEGQGADGDGNIGIRWSIVPEPGSGLLSALLSLALLLRRRRRTVRL
ncbi:MAG: PEP-CTERM sorting domain-containing protein [Verrucomicrobiota bacterium]